MPHKHKRKHDDDGSSFNLAPTIQAKPLAAYNKASLFTTDEGSSPPKRRKSNGAKSKKPQDDTPKAFARLMSWHTAGKKPQGLDDGTSTKKKSSKKQSKSTTSTPNPKSENDLANKLMTTDTAPTASATTQIPKILPGESLANFSLRVDQSLPLSSITNSSNINNNQQGSKPAPPLPADIQARLKSSTRTTKHNKRLQRMQSDWRAEEARLRERELDRLEDQADQIEEDNLLWSGVRAARGGVKGKKKKKQKNNGNGDGDAAAAGDDSDGDPWKDLEKKRREETKQKSLQDVVKAPPVLKKISTTKFKSRKEDFDLVDASGSGGKRRDGTANNANDGDVVGVDVKDVPGKVGSLRRREELSAMRREVIEAYRKNVRGKGAKRGLGERLNLSKQIKA